MEFIKRSLELLDKYLLETPENEIIKAAERTSALGFHGPSVVEYFEGLDCSTAIWFSHESNVDEEIIAKSIENLGVFTGSVSVLGEKPGKVPFWDNTGFSTKHPKVTEQFEMAA